MEATPNRDKVKWRAGPGWIAAGGLFIALTPINWLLLRAGSPNMAIVSAVGTLILGVLMVLARWWRAAMIGFILTGIVIGVGFLAILGSDVFGGGSNSAVTRCYFAGHYRPCQWQGGWLGSLGAVAIVLALFAIGSLVRNRHVNRAASRP